MDWYVKRGEDGERGPYTSDALASSFREGYLSDATLVRAADTPDGWRPFATARAEIGLPIAPTASAPREPSSGAMSDDALRESTLRDASQNAKMDIFVGIAAIVIGAGISIVSFQSASDMGGGRYLVAYGPVVWGLFKIGRAFKHL